MPETSCQKDNKWKNEETSSLENSNEKLKFSYDQRKLSIFNIGAIAQSLASTNVQVDSKLVKSPIKQFEVVSQPKESVKHKIWDLSKIPKYPKIKKQHGADGFKKQKLQKLLNAPLIKNMIQCPNCTKLFKSPQALGGHSSTVHPGQSLIYAKRQVVRSLNESKRENNKRIALHFLRKMIESQEISNYPKL